MAKKKKTAEKEQIPVGLTRGEYNGEGSTAQWKRGKFRKQAEAWRKGGGSIDANESDEDNIREKQAHLKNEAAWSKRQEKTGKKLTVEGPTLGRKNAAKKKATKKQSARKR